MLRSGQRRHLVTIQSKALVTDEWGGTIDGWADFAKAWAAIRMSRGRELVAAQAVQSEMVGTFNIAYRAGITQDMRVLYGGKYYNIKAVVDINEQHRDLDLMVSTGLNEG